LDIFFGPEAGNNTSDQDGEHVLSREGVEAVFNVERRATFFNEIGEKVVITADPTA
jgi:hypothetical protein